MAEIENDNESLEEGIGIGTGRVRMGGIGKGEGKVGGEECD